MKKISLILLLLTLSFYSLAQSRYISQKTKQIVFARDGGRCQCCHSSSSLQYDHIKPFSCGGGNGVSNIQLLCQRCNGSKSNSNTCKIHNKTVGVGGCQGNTSTFKSSSTYKGKSTSTARQCSGITKKGLRCKNRTTNANGRCHHH